jgi:hypothetical protein
VTPAPAERIIAAIMAIRRALIAQEEPQPEQTLFWV